MAGFGPDNRVREIGAAERLHYHGISLPEAERGTYIPAYVFCGCGGKCHHRSVEHVPQARYIAVRWTEIMPPLRYAVRFVDRHERHAYVTRGVDKRFCEDPFGCYVKKFYAAFDGFGHVTGCQVMRQSAVYVPGGYAFFAERLYLVFHKRNERRYDQRDAVGHQRRNLVTYGFAASGRHYGHYVATREDAVYGFLLGFAEFLVPPIPAQSTFAVSVVIFYMPYVFYGWEISDLSSVTKPDEELSLYAHLGKHDDVIPERFSCRGSQQHSYPRTPERTQRNLMTSPIAGMNPKNPIQKPYLCA